LFVDAVAVAGALTGFVGATTGLAGGGGTGDREGATSAGRPQPTEWATIARATTDRLRFFNMRFSSTE
jgi:hypothetical protein